MAKKKEAGKRKSVRKPKRPSKRTSKRPSKRTSKRANAGASRAKNITSLIKANKGKTLAGLGLVGLGAGAAVTQLRARSEAEFQRKNQEFMLSLSERKNDAKKYVSDLKNNHTERDLYKDPTGIVEDIDKILKMLSKAESEAAGIPLLKNKSIVGLLDTLNKAMVHSIGLRSAEEKPIRTTMSILDTKSFDGLLELAERVKDKLSKTIKNGIHNEQWAQEIENLDFAMRTANTSRNELQNLFVQKKNFKDILERQEYYKNLNLYQEQINIYLNNPINEDEIDITVTPTNHFQRVMKNYLRDQHLLKKQITKIHRNITPIDDVIQPRNVIVEAVDSVVVQPVRGLTTGIWNGVAWLLG